MDDLGFDEIQKEEKKVDQTLGIIGLVFSIIGLVAGCCYGIGTIFSIPGIICSAIQLKKGKSGLATAGLIIGIIGACLGVIFLIFIISYVNTSEFQELYSSIMESMNAQS